MIIQSTLRVKDRYHNIDLVSVVHVCVTDDIIVTLCIYGELVVVVVVLVDVVADVGNDREDVHSWGKYIS